MDPIRMTTAAAPPPDPIPFTLDGVDFVWQPPKDSILTLKLMRLRAGESGPLDNVAQADLLFDHVRLGLDEADRRVNGREITRDGTPLDRDDSSDDAGPTQWQQLVGRLEDPDDPFGLAEAIELFGRLIAAQKTGDSQLPPTS